jgi:hypothetical protein
MTQNELILICIAGVLLGLFITCLLLAIQYYKRWRVVLTSLTETSVNWNDCRKKLKHCVNELNGAQDEARRLRRNAVKDGINIYKLQNKLSLYQNHPDEAVRMALYPKQKLVVSTEGGDIGAGVILNFEGALELEGLGFQIESPVRMQGYWTRQGLYMTSVDPMLAIPPMDRVETFIYAV